MAEELVTVAEFWTSFQAELARQTLEEAGIPSVIEDEAWARIYGMASQGAKLKVPAHLAERAEEILADLQQPSDETEEDDAK